MYDIDRQKDMLKIALAELKAARVSITGVYMPTSESDAGVEIEGRYILQIADYCIPCFILDTISLEEVQEFATVRELISFLTEKQ